MALRLLTKSASVARPALAAQRSTASVAIRHMATSAEEKQVSPESKAQSIIDSLPGNSLITKTGYVTALAGAATYLISKEIYVFNEESLVLLAFAATFGGIVQAAREPLFNAWADEHINKIRSVLLKARVDHKVAVEDRIDQVGQMKDVVDVTKALYALSKETAKLEAEAFELKQQVAMTAEVKSVLDSWVRYETSVREREQSKLTAYMIEKIKADLADPKLQSQILAESINQVEKIAASKA